MAEPRRLDPAEHPCRCVTRHTPDPIYTERHHVIPLGWGGPDTWANILPLCPTGHANVHRLLDAHREHGEDIPWETAREAGPYLRAVALDGWRRWKETQ